MTIPAYIHTDDGHMLHVDLEASQDIVGLADEWSTYLRPFFRQGVFAARRGDEVVFVPAERVSFITMPISGDVDS